MIGEKASIILREAASAEGAALQPVHNLAELRSLIELQKELHQVKSMTDHEALSDAKKFFCNAKATVQQLQGGLKKATGKLKFFMELEEMTAKRKTGDVQQGEEGSC